MEYIVAILIGVFVFHRKRFDSAGGVENNIKKDNYLLVLSIYYLFNLMIIGVFINILEVDNELINNSIELVFNSFFTASIVLPCLLIVKDYYENGFRFNETPYEAIVIALFIKLCEWQNFFIEDTGMSEVRQFTLFSTYVVIWIVANYCFNKIIREAIEEKRKQ